MISLRTRLIATYTIALSALILVLGILTNVVVSNLFLNFAKENIKTHSELIVSSLSDQWDPNTETFRIVPLQALGMNFVHQGYIISVDDASGRTIWGARDCDMQQCQLTITQIEQRMKDQGKSSDGLHRVSYPLAYGGKTVGKVTIETYAPYFYTQSESNFISSLNRLLIFAMFALIAFVVLTSLLVTPVLVAPIAKVVDAAKKIARGDLSVRVGQNNKTRELNQLAHSIDDLALALENGERYQKQLTSNIAHELRTPLTALQGNIEAMIDGVWEPTPGRLMSAHEEIVRLSQLVASLGQISLLEQENLQLKKTEFDIPALLHGVAGQFSLAAQQKGIAITLDVVNTTIVADYDRLKQVFINLISNAINYTNEGVISVIARTDGSTLTVSVKDTGAGIAPEDLERIFDRFYRVDKSRARGTGGSGIGLAVASAIVHAHGGEITAKSIEDVGSDFTVTLPVG